MGNEKKLFQCYETYYISSRYMNTFASNIEKNLFIYFSKKAVISD
jgi:hypothetical protein